MLNMTDHTAPTVDGALDSEKKLAQPKCPSDEGMGEAEDLAAVRLDPAKETKLLAKLDLAFVPVIMFAYLTCFLDRSNIGWSSPNHTCQSHM